MTENFPFDGENDGPRSISTGGTVWPSSNVDEAKIVDDNILKLRINESVGDNVFKKKPSSLDEFERRLERRLERKLNNSSN